MLKSNNLCIVFFFFFKEENTFMVQTGHTCGRQRQSGLSKLVRSCVEGATERLCGSPAEHQCRASHQEPLPLVKGPEGGALLGLLAIGTFGRAEPGCAGLICISITTSTAAFFFRPKHAGSASKRA